jgi:hypothetical protein
MTRFIALAIACLVATPAFAAETASDFQTVTITDIPGKSYEVIDGICQFATSPKFFETGLGDMIDAATQAAILLIARKAKTVKASALVGMTVMPVLRPNSTNPKDFLSSSGVNVCGTLVRFAPHLQASAR